MFIESASDLYVASEKYCVNRKHRLICQEQYNKKEKKNCQGVVFPQKQMFEGRELA